MPDLSLLVVLLLVVLVFLVGRWGRRPRVVRCQRCRLEMVHDAELPDVVDMIPDVTKGLAPPPTRTDLYHCPGCGRRARLRS
ncbi:MAG TPA: hypothetical protein VII06_16350 [Chloroflexota bacterium]